VAMQEAFDEYTRNAELFFDMNRYSEQYAKFVSDIAKKGWTCLFGDEQIIDPILTIAECMEHIGMKWEDPRPAPRQYARVEFECPEEHRQHYPFDRDETFIYFGEIPNMPGHCVVLSDKDKQFHIGYHIENFREWDDEEALIFSDTIGE